MSMLEPQDDFGRTHVSALLLLGVAALADDVHAMAPERGAVPAAEPGDMHYALLGLCAVGDYVRGLAGVGQSARPASAPTTRTLPNDKVLR